MRMARFFVALLVALCFATPALAQDAKPVTIDEFKVTITPPEKWEVAQGNDKAVANFKHRGSQSQIEVVGTKLMTADVADVFFNTFHKTLKESGFELEDSKKDVAVGDYKGTRSNYKFQHSGVTLSVVVFEFTRENTAWLVVGYMQQADKEKYVKDFDSVVTTMKFN